MMHAKPWTDPNPKRPDPVDANKSDMLPGGRNAGQWLGGTQMSTTQLRRGGLAMFRNRKP